MIYHKNIICKMIYVFVETNLVIIGAVCVAFSPLGCGQEERMKLLQRKAVVENVQILRKLL